MAEVPHVIVVGAGFAGCVAARCLADAGARVQVFEKRSHVGGNAHDRVDEHGVLVHPYGPHIFHTNAPRVVDWLSRFTEWRPYEHRVLAKVNDRLVPLPINRTTINSLYGLNLDEAEVARFLNDVRSPRDVIKTSEDVVLNSVGQDLCDKFFSGYTRKQWGLELHQLSAGVAARIPTRTNDDDRYFTDTFQAMPLEGFTAMFERMLEHPDISLALNEDYRVDECREAPEHTVYTGPIDAFYGFRFGKLPYRSLHFEHQHIAQCDQLQTVGTINFPNDFAYTRITEFKHLTGQMCSGTSVVTEYPCADGEPFYPIPRPENEALYQRYKALAKREKCVTFVGRLAQYRYYNMDQVVAASLAASEKIIAGLRLG